MAEMEANHQADDLTAERAAATLLERMGLVGHPADAQFIGDIIEFRRQTRQEALREAKQVVERLCCITFDDKSMWARNDVRRALNELDRLASEGA